MSLFALFTTSNKYDILLGAIDIIVLKKKDTIYAIFL